MSKRRFSLVARNGCAKTFAAKQNRYLGVQLLGQQMELNLRQLEEVHERRQEQIRYKRRARLWRPSCPRLVSRVRSSHTSTGPQVFGEQRLPESHPAGDHQFEEQPATAQPEGNSRKGKKCSISMSELYEGYSAPSLCEPSGGDVAEDAGVEAQESLCAISRKLREWREAALLNSKKS